MGMGTWGMGGGLAKDSSNVQESITALKLGLSLGIRLVDTAEVYGAGLAEEIVGQAIKSYLREDIFIISKVWKDHLKYDEVLRAAEASLQRLGTDYIDLYLIHSPSEAVPLAETMRAMESVMNKGLAKHIGVSNFDVSQIQKASGYLKNTKISANQIEYNIAIQNAGKELIPFCKSNDIKVIAYRPLARGLLAKESGDTINFLAGKYNKTPIQIALNWIISQDIIAIPKAIKREHLVENFGALGWKLDDGDIRLLSKIK